MAISEKNTRLTIIIPKDIKHNLKILAEYNNRSLSNFIVHILEQELYKQIDELEKLTRYDILNQMIGINNKNINE